MRIFLCLSLAVLAALPAVGQTTCQGVVAENMTGGVLSLSQPTPASACQAITKFNLGKDAQLLYEKLGLAKGDTVSLTLTVKEGVGDVSGIVLVNGVCDVMVANTMGPDGVVQFTVPCKGEEKLDFSPKKEEFTKQSIVIRDILRVAIAPGEIKDGKQGPTKVLSFALIQSEFQLNAVVHAVAPQTGTILLANPERVGVPDSANDPKLSFVDRGSPTQFFVSDTAARERLNDFSKGDRVRVRATYLAGVPPRLNLDRIRAITMEDENPSNWEKLGLLVVPPIVLAVLASFITKWNALSLFFVGMDNQTSNSKTQASLWFFLVLTAFCAVFGARLIYGDYLFGSVGMPPNLGVLAGISGLTFVGAKAIRTSQEEKSKDDIRKKIGDLKIEVDGLRAKGDDVSKAEADRKNLEIKSLEAKLNQQPVEAPKPDAQPAGAARTALTELTTDRQEGLSLGDSQMIFITLVAVIAYLLQLWHYLGTMELRAGISLPDIDGSLTALFGISQGTYLANKSANKPVK